MLLAILTRCYGKYLRRAFCHRFNGNETAVLGLITHMNKLSPVATEPLRPLTYIVPLFGADINNSL